MFVNFTRQVDPLESLENSPFKFYLTGSRFFGNNRKSSDYDFFAVYCTDVEEFLQREGFRNISLVETNYFGTDGIKGLYRNSNVDVQLVSDPELKARVQEVLKNSEQFMNAGKPNRKVMWSLALEFAVSMK